MKDLASGSEHMEFTMDAILNKSPIRVWVDSKEAPLSAFMWDKAYIFYFLGKSDNHDFNNSIKELVMTEIKDKIHNIVKMEFYPKSWETSLQEVFKSNFPTTQERILLRFNKNRISSKNKSYIRRITKETLQSGIKNIDTIHDELNQMWDSSGDFLENGFGYCTIIEEKGEETVQGWCTGEYFSMRKCGIGIETFSPYQSKGYATEMATAFVNHALSKNITVYWESYKRNLSSLRVAEKVGFDITQKYSVYLIGLKNVEAHKGRYFFAEKEFRKAAESFIKATELEPESKHNYFYNAASCWALSGNKKLSLEFLKKSVDSANNVTEGFLLYLKNDDRFTFLHELKGWQTLISEIEELFE
jgi:RimJ/RimL family protein N-acetyltransferase